MSGAAAGVAAGRPEPRAACDAGDDMPGKTSRRYWRCKEREGQPAPSATIKHCSHMAAKSPRLAARSPHRPLASCPRPPSTAHQYSAFQFYTTTRPSASPFCGARLRNVECGEGIDILADSRQPGTVRPHSSHLYDLLAVYGRYYIRMYRWITGTKLVPSRTQISPVFREYGALCELLTVCAAQQISPSSSSLIDPLPASVLGPQFSRRTARNKTAH